MEVLLPAEGDGAVGADRGSRDLRTVGEEDRSRRRRGRVRRGSEGRRDAAGTEGGILGDEVAGRSPRLAVGVLCGSGPRGNRLFDQVAVKESRSDRDGVDKEDCGSGNDLFGVVRRSETRSDCVGAYEDDPRPGHRDHAVPEYARLRRGRARTKTYCASVSLSLSLRRLTYGLWVL